MSDENSQTNFSRRGFFARGALLGSGLMSAATSRLFGAERTGSIMANSRPDVPYDFADPEHCLYTVCLNCNTGCGIKAKIQEGIVTKIDGNPYNPWTLFPHLPGSSTPFDAVGVDGSICPKGQAGLQATYDPYRIRKVLKRAGKRGENKWVTIDFATAIKEIVEGGKLFAKVPGEENREVEGLRALMAMRDPKAGKAMVADVAAIWKEKDKEKKQALVAAFKEKHAAHLGELIDPEHPDLGPRNNQFTIAWGRLKGGRSDFIKRFGAAYGTTNLHGHTTVCQGSLYFTSKAMSEQYEGGKFGGGNKFYWQADTENAHFILFIGANLFEANYGPPNRSVRLTDNIVQGKTRIAVVDPRFSKVASKAWKWLPIQPGTDGALAMAFLRWMIEREKFDAKFLSAANKAAAKAAGETTWSNAAWLVEVKEGEPGAFVRAADHGLAQAEQRSIPDPKDKTKTIDYEEKFLLVQRDGQFIPLDPNDAANAVTGDLFVDAALPDGTRVKSSLQLIREAAFEKTFDEWCAVCGLDPVDVGDVVAELCSHGKRGAVDIHRGVAQHTNGFYNVLGWYSVNALLGNYDWQGGMSALKTYGYDGSKGGPFDIGHTPGKLSAFGISLIRHDADYSATTIFEGYPAKRNWYPLASDVYEEIIPSIGDAYPYPTKALLTYMGAPTYSLPAGHTNIEILRDVKKLPLYIASDILVGSTSLYADYIFPDLTYLERWEFQGSHPNMNLKVESVRQPVIAPIPESCTVFGEEQPVSLETLLLALAEQLKLPAFGPDGFDPGKPLVKMDDYYLRCVANIAAGTKPDGSEAVPDADAAEQELFTNSRRHLPKTVFDEARWRAIVGAELWPKVVHLLNRGGRYQDFSAMAKAAPRLPNPYAKLINLYQEKTAKARYAGTGKHYRGHACFVTLADYHGKPLDELAKGADLHLITHRVISATKSRTISNYWLRPLLPENAILMNPRDARRLSLDDGDAVKVVSNTNPQGEWPLGEGVKKPMIGRVQLTETMRPGVVSFALGFGHWATGAQDTVIDGEVIPGDPRRAAGIHANAAMWVDPTLKNTCLLDPVGGSVSFYDSKIRLEKMPAGTLPPQHGRMRHEAQHA
jgi:anaerobic selenocysteine-containing dehydrogenase